MANRPICVVLVIDDLGYGGAERQVVELANNMDPARFDVHICVLSKHVPLSNVLRDAEHRLHIIERRSRLDCGVILRLSRMLRVLRADIVHGYLFIAEISTRLAGRLAGTRVVIGSERNSNKALCRSHTFANRLTGRCVDAIVANSYAGAESNSRIFRRPPSDYRVVHNGVDAERFQPRDGKATRQSLGLSPECPVIGVFANFKPQKNHAMLFRAFRQVLDLHREARLLLIGERPADSRGRLNAYKAQLDGLIDELQIRDRCIFLGHREVVEDLYPACDVTVLASLYEGTPNVLLESMACGVPVIATDVSDNGYIVKDGRDGYLVAVGDDAALADRMHLLLSNEALRAEMGKEARNRILGEFSTKRLGEKMETVYLELLNRKRGQHRPAGVLRKAVN